eukprot:365323-Chlamydomonas_euryale.AAC.23
MALRPTLTALRPHRCPETPRRSAQHQMVLQTPAAHGPTALPSSTWCCRCCARPPQLQPATPSSSSPIQRHMAKELLACGSVTVNGVTNSNVHPPLPVLKRKRCKRGACYTVHGCL